MLIISFISKLPRDMVKNEQKLAIRKINKTHCTLLKTNTGHATRKDGEVRKAVCLFPSFQAA